MKNLTTRVPN